MLTFYHGRWKIKVVENNDHLGQIVSGDNQIQKNIDLRLNKGRKSLFGLLGSGFQYKSCLSPAVKLNLYKTFICPITRSGLSTFAIRPNQMEPLSLFQRKILKSILSLSKYATTPSIHFLSGEIPIEGVIHKDMFSLFYSLWCNPDLKVHQIVKYLFMNSTENSRTWSVYLKQISKMYDMEDPSECLEREPPTKSEYKNYIKTKISVYYEKELRKQ